MIPISQANWAAAMAQNSGDCQEPSVQTRPPWGFWRSRMNAALCHPAMRPVPWLGQRAPLERSQDLGGAICRDPVRQPVWRAEDRCHQETGHEPRFCWS